MHMTTKEAAAAAHTVLSYLSTVQVDSPEAQEFRKEMRDIEPQFSSVQNIITWLRATEKNLSEVAQWDRENPEP
jgi:hypothetical protein